MTARRNETTNQVARNLIRVVTGSYFMALALDLVTGLDKAVLFAAFLDPRTADIAGSTILLCLSATFMIGYHLRLSALSLALFIFASSLAQHMVHVEPGAVSAFWRDITLICAIMLSYMTLSPHEIRSASMLGSRARRSALVQKPVKPRRITPTASHKRPVQLEIRRALKTVETAPRQPRVAEDEREVLNIFANI
ncbi:hypothetical protein [Roseovarius azorensis]|uniref:hypothetical protein n=1 Tax=Roseovarius azorensis TaxID=1287727 RepID=UPI001114AFCA|nr:hypothetical protein [Roseovarius azorensis]